MRARLRRPRKKSEATIEAYNHRLSKSEDKAKVELDGMAKQPILIIKIVYELAMKSFEIESKKRDLRDC